MRFQRLAASAIQRQWRRKQAAKARAKLNVAKNTRSWQLQRGYVAELRRRRVPINLPPTNQLGVRPSSRDILSRRQRSLASRAMGPYGLGKVIPDADLLPARVFANALVNKALERECSERHLRRKALASAAADFNARNEIRRVRAANAEFDAALSDALVRYCIVHLLVCGVISALFQRHLHSNLVQNDAIHHLRFPLGIKCI